MFQQLKKYIFPKQISIILSCDDRISESGTWMDGWMKIIFLSAITIAALRALKLTDHLFLRLCQSAQQDVGSDIIFAFKKFACKRAPSERFHSALLPGETAPQLSSQ